MKPTEKAPAINQALKDIFDIDRVASIEANQCIFCKSPLVSFRNAISAREAAISGQCQKCQDKVFGYDEPDDLFPPEPPKPERQYYAPTENDYVVQRQPMRSGQGEAQSRRYFKHRGKSGRLWLVADQVDAAANIYVEGGPNSDGFGGATLTFPIVDGSEVKLKGPWHSNSDALYSDTGIDARNKHYTFVVISREREYGRDFETICKDVLYKDDEPVLGDFKRGDAIAKEMAERLGHKVHLFSQSQGGSSSGWVYPEGQEPQHCKSCIAWHSPDKHTKEPH